jgi:hypothetical protein
MGVTDQALMWSRWVMPYRASAELAVRNLGDQPVRLHIEIDEAPYAWNDRSMHLHAGWRVARDVPTRPKSDWNYVTVSGQGVFVGAAYTLANPVRAWWGEGDEKIYVDDEAFPSHFGTGTEDYFGYAWSRPDVFTHAYHNQPRSDGPKNYGRSAVNRWHVLDAIPFMRALRFDMEIWHWRDVVLPEMSVVSYWYARPGATCNLGVPPAEALRVVDAPPFAMERVPGVLEGEALEIGEHTGTAGPHDLDGCSNGQNLRWWGAAPRDTLTLTFSVTDSGRYRLFARFVQCHNYGLFRLTVNGQPAGLPVDLYNPEYRITPERALGEVELRAGANELKVEIIGAHGDAEKGYRFGLDYLRLRRAS